MTTDNTAFEKVLTPTNTRKILKKFLRRVKIYKRHLHILQVQRLHDAFVCSRAGLAY